MKSRASIIIVILILIPQFSAFGLKESFYHKGGTHLFSVRSSTQIDISYNNLQTVEPITSYDPYARIISPKDGSIVEGGATIIVDVSGHDILASLIIDGSTVKTWNTPGRHYYRWVIVGSNNYHTIELRVISFNYFGEVSGIASDKVTVYNGETPHEIFVLVIGINDYSVLSDLSECANDAADWYYHFVNHEGVSPYNIRIYGDDSSYYPSYSGIAIEHNVKLGLEWLISSADTNDIIVFIDSGHGGYAGNGVSFLDMWDSESGMYGEDGMLYDYELSSFLGYSVAKGIFVFLDACHSGGFGDDLMSLPNRENIYLTTTSTALGSGYDDRVHNNGLWTYYFLEFSWQSHFRYDKHVPMESVFLYAVQYYPKSGVDRPQQYDGDTNNSFIFF